MNISEDFYIDGETNMKIRYKIHEWKSPTGSKYDCARVTIRAEYFLENITSIRYVLIHV